MAAEYAGLAEDRFCATQACPKSQKQKHRPRWSSVIGLRQSEGQQNNKMPDSNSKPPDSFQAWPSANLVEKVPTAITMVALQ